MGPNGREGANRARAGAGAVGCGLGLWAGARRANVALICSVNILGPRLR